MTKMERVLKALEKGQKLTPLVALKKGMGLRLGGQVYKLRKKGYDIKTKMVFINGSFVAEYRMKVKGK